MIARVCSNTKRAEDRWLYLLRLRGRAEDEFQGGMVYVCQALTAVAATLGNLKDCQL